MDGKATCSDGIRKKVWMIIWGDLFSLNNYMQKSKIYGRLVSFIPVRRGNWIFKASVFTDKYVMLICYNISSAEFFVRHFSNQHEAVNFLEMLAEKDQNPPANHTAERTGKTL